MECLFIQFAFYIDILSKNQADRSFWQNNSGKISGVLAVSCWVSTSVSRQWIPIVIIQFSGTRYNPYVEHSENQRKFFKPHGALPQFSLAARKFLNHCRRIGHRDHQTSQCVTSFSGVIVLELVINWLKPLSTRTDF